jgi:hypothetical protein
MSNEIGKKKKATQRRGCSPPVYERSVLAINAVVDHVEHERVTLFVHAVFLERPRLARLKLYSLDIIPGAESIPYAF